MGNTNTEYTPGHSRNASDFMLTRTLASHGQFFSEFLAPGLTCLDCGCGPGSITQGIAERVNPGRVIGIDFGASQIARASEAASVLGLTNVSFQTADCHALPFDSASFDRVFSHALFEHLSEPVRAAKELHRVLRNDGMVGVCSPDWGGFIVAPPSLEINDAMESYRNLQRRNGGDVEAGRKLGAHLTAAGFEVLRMSARYECYESLEFIGEYLALQLDRSGAKEAAKAFRAWAGVPGGMFAQAWVSVVARKRK